MEKKSKKPIKKIKPRLIIVSSSTSSSKRAKTLKKASSSKKNKSIKKPKKLNKPPILLVEATPSPSENEKIDLKMCYNQLKVQCGRIHTTIKCKIN